VHCSTFLSNLVSQKLCDSSPLSLFLLASTSVRNFFNVYICGITLRLGLRVRMKHLYPVVIMAVNNCFEFVFYAVICDSYDIVV